MTSLKRLQSGVTANPNQTGDALLHRLAQLIVALCHGLSANHQQDKACVCARACAHVKHQVSKIFVATCNALAPHNGMPPPPPHTKTTRPCGQFSMPIDDHP